MSPVLSLLLSLASCTLLRGMLLPPRDVRLEAQNFHTFLRWEPDPSSPRGATYEVEWRRWGRPSRWTKADGCWGNSTGSSWECELHFNEIHSIYWARVRAVAGGELSEWACSSELQPYRDTMVGPPRLSWLLQSDILEVKITMPLTPFRSKTGSYKPVDRVLQKLWYQLRLYEGDVLIQQVPCKQSRKVTPCTFKFLKPSTQYCVRTVAVGMTEEQSCEAEQCLVTPAAPAGFPWVLLAVLSGVFLLSVAGLCFIQLHVFPSPSEMHLPTVLAVLNRELGVPVRVPTLHLEESSLALLLPTMLPSHGSPVAEQTAPTAQLILGESISQDVRGYCANGFGPDCHEGRDPSCSFTQPGPALDSQVSSQLEEDEEAHDEDDVLEQLVLAGLTRGSYAADRHYQASESWVSLRLQLYSTCQCPVLEEAPGRSLSQEDLQESLGVARPWVPLSSVRLPATEEEDRGQLVQSGPGTEPQPGDSSMQQDDSEPAAQAILSSCQLPQLLKSLQAYTFSGYELHPSVDSEPQRAGEGTPPWTGHALQLPGYQLSPSPASRAGPTRGF